MGVGFVRCLQLKRKKFNTLLDMYWHVGEVEENNWVLKSNTCLGEYSFLLECAGKANSWHTWRSLRVSLLFQNVPSECSTSQLEQIAPEEFKANFCPFQSKTFYHKTKTMCLYSIVYDLSHTSKSHLSIIYFSSLFLSLSLHPPIYPSIYPSIHPSINPFIYFQGMKHTENFWSFFSG